MGKIDYDRDDLVRVQKVGGASIELHGKFAGDIIASIKDMSWIDLGKSGAGNFILQVTGGMTAPKEDPSQRKLDLKDVKRIDPQQLIADIAPSESMIKAFEKILTGMVIMSAGYDEGTGLYTMTVSNGKKKAQEWQLRFVNCTVTEVLPEKKKPAKAGREATVAGEDLSPYPKDDDSLNACLYEALWQNGRQFDRWAHLQKNGADVAHLLVHVREIFGKIKKLKKVTIRGMGCEIIGGAAPSFGYDCGNQKTDPIHLTDATLLSVVREVMEVGEQKKDDE